MTVITADDVAAKHQYLADNRPDWSQSMASIRNHGGPWWCDVCDTASLLCYRCSACGAELADD